MNLDNYQGLIFDLDGTLLKTDPANNAAWQEAMARHGLTFDAEFRDRLGGASSIRMAQEFIKAAQCDIDPDQLVAEKNAILTDILLAKSSPLPLINLVKKQYGKKKMAVGTGSSRPVVLRLLNHFELLPYFDVVVTSSDVSNHKPAPDTFLRCAELLGIAPHACVVFEDADFGLQAAASAGMQAIDVRVTNIEEL